MADRMKDLWDRFHHQKPLPLPPGVDRVELGIDPATGQAESRMHRIGRPPEIHRMDVTDDHIRDAILYGRGARVQYSPPTLEKFSNAELIHEMLERGFAVMKLPAAGGPPETLRNG